MAHPTQRNGAFSSTGLSRFFALRILFASAMAFALFLFASLFLLASDTASSNYDNMGFCGSLSELYGSDLQTFLPRFVRARFPGDRRVGASAVREGSEGANQVDQGQEARCVFKLDCGEIDPQELALPAMRLMEERIAHPEKYSDEGKPTPPELEDPKLYHYAIFSDNVIAASVVVNSAVKNAKEPWKHVFHVVTDKMNLGAMQVMFKMRDYNGSHIEVKAVEDYKFLNSSYVPVLRQLESANLQRFYFENKIENATKDTTNMKFRNPKYLSMLNHLRFYLPEMYPKLHRILFLDDDVVVQRDLTGLWKIDMDGKVNGAVETCFGSFHRYAQYMNFSHPLIKEKFNPKACGWAYGMNFFDLDAWRKEKCTEQYHYWQNLNENRTLWKLGTLPPGLITFYSTTKPLDKSWHVLGLGYNPSISMDEIHNAAVVHFNGNMKPWLDIAMNQFRPLWTKHVDYDMEFVQACNFGL
ncbi:Galacturonosyltransferase 8 [Vitis vinifera]|uniref:Hexosyltransferase n=1 Tax=Vitis vinifera TaxID=29760 RepID=A0A438HPX1_VITVI|nr:Galacturonosyltransferase 8 [Vitis vinifera]